MKNLMALIAVLSLTLLNCTNQEKQNNQLKDSKKSQVIEKSHWLIGNWQSKSAKGILTETWYKQDDSTMIGKSYFIEGSDTLSMENIRMEQRNGMLTYIPVVRDQNNGKAVSFALTNSTDSSLVFENPKHDFPQKISYVLMANDSLVAEVSAVVEEKIKSQVFRMSRVTN